MRLYEFSLPTVNSSVRFVIQRQADRTSDAIIETVEMLLE